MFTDEQKKQLAAPLSSANVKGRSQGGRTVNYIESWKAIEEANRIFGFDGWSSETVDVKCVSERERDIGQQKTPGWSVSYTAKVRIRLGSELIREGVGAGHGIDRDIGQAHESAIKEAESDARKRALMTLGYQFGLALYDKQQEHVADDKPVPKAKGPQAVPPNAPVTPAVLAEPLATEVMEKLKADITGCVTWAELDKFWRSEGFVHRVGALPDKHRNHIRVHGKERMTFLKEREGIAA